MCQLIEGYILHFRIIKQEKWENGITRNTILRLPGKLLIPMHDPRLVRFDALPLLLTFVVVAAEMIAIEVWETFGDTSGFDRTPSWLKLNMKIILVHTCTIRLMLQSRLFRISNNTN